MKSGTELREGKAELLLLAVVVIWASNFPVAKFGIAGLNPFVFNALRYLVAGCVIGIIFAFRGTWIPVLPSDRMPLLRLGLIASVVYQLAFMYGLSLTSAGNSAVLLSTAPLWTVLINARIHREPVPRGTIAGMLASFVGVLFIILGSGKKLEFGTTPLAGDILVLGAACLWGVNTNLQKPLLVRYSAVQLTLIMTLFGAAGLSIAAIPSIPSIQPRDVAWTHIMAAVVSGALSIGTANLFWSVGVKRLGPRRTANFNNLVPVLAFIISFLVLGEKFSYLQMSGAALTIAGVWIARR
jgi:drug/metabolite transporter (DMT)-like permease